MTDIQRLAGPGRPRFREHNLLMVQTVRGTDVRKLAYQEPECVAHKWRGNTLKYGVSNMPDCPTDPSLPYRVLVGRLESKIPLARPRRRLEDNIKMDLREVGYNDRDWINLAQDRDRWRAYVRAAMNLRVP
ncbi:hypothetical protein ANN_07734 [Periplaneta americana]|uniref:Uncharacterized protein n=1 Tax=Periplaneta americana TaxID=6978 RepID=A0ABQ8T0T1_PERAM|nr:hypothetical protein ANN_07734 [Periplaneta americana]